MNTVKVEIVGRVDDGPWAEDAIYRVRLHGEKGTISVKIPIAELIAAGLKEDIPQ